MPAKRSSIADKLLAWYDVNARALPWRAPPGTPAPDPYRVWLSEIMLQQTTVATVRPKFEAFTARWPDFASFAAADEAEVMAAWAGLGYYARARNLIACARAVVAEYGGRLPDTEAALRTLPGIGDYSAAAIASIAFGRRAVALDANVERVVARLFAISEPLPAGRKAIRQAAESIAPDPRSGDLWQAMMDLGQAICTAKAPKCLLCPLADDCAGRATGAPETYPVKAPKRARPQRYGTLFWLEHDGRVLLVRRPSNGLLGGMRALPTGPWGDAPPGLAGAPAAADWTMRNTTITHVFTHFRLTCALAVAHGEGHAAAGEWWPIGDLGAAGLPTIFLKAARVLGREECGD
ncbi:MAG TPA: A/G-specific adenine glycosylase [Sphingomonas sp.]|nr:A/G-specific adenine glycosylase [Sphingomonas sp.]